MKDYLKNYPRLDNKTILITGASDGIGKSLAFQVATLGGNLVLACRNKDKTLRVIEEIRNVNKDINIDLVIYDQSSFESIDVLIDYIKNHKLDVIVLNAGIYHPKKEYRSKEGFPLAFGTNYLGVYHLLTELETYLDENKIKTVVVTSLVASMIKDQKLDNIEKMGGNARYSFSKRCISQLVYELDSKSKNKPYYLTHPGICKTNIISSKETSFGHIFVTLGHGFLYLFMQPKERASLSLLSSICYEDKFVAPRGLFHISGLPGHVRKKFKDRNIIKRTEDYIKENKNVRS